ncbi:cyclic nucleotide-binding and patatin-like phospholipase domain-containing protein [Azonexus sp. IMCC34842]|uniref:cyclic nucleotide-binding and patatin-like phospholipase domain-containing protein n=1 Tax=Azonexus sp. IMCC34842 TaxID=3420950 RepID=UPI003D10E8C0
MLTTSIAADKLVEVLQASRVFGMLEMPVLQDLAGELELTSVRGGDLVLHEGDTAESMLILVSGRLRVSRRNADGSLLLYNEICPGESVGETGMVLQQSRFADVTAVRDSTIALLRREPFEVLLRRHPVALNRVFTQAVYQQLRHAPQLVEQRRAHTFVVVPLHDRRLGAEVAAGLAEALGAIGRTEKVREAALDLPHFDELESRFEYLVLETDETNSERTHRAVRQADQVVFVAAEGESPGLSGVERGLSSEAGFVMKRKHLVLLHKALAEHPGDMPAWQRGREIERVYPVRAGRQRDYARLARFLTGTAVGVVLGGGGARGFSHLGVLRALEENAIPVDLIGGNSMGALIGAQYASGVPIDEIRQRTQRFALGGERPTLPLISLLSGKRLERDLRKMFGETCIEQLWRPFFAAACNLSQVCTTVQDSGPIWRAVLASNSPAGLLPPVVHKGDLLVDGAILDNVPVSAMRGRLGTPLEQRRGNGTVIAVDVDVRENMCVHPETVRLSVWRTLKGYLRSAGDGSPSIASILYRAGHIGGMHQRARTMALADYCLEPPVADFPLMAYRRSDEIVEAGYRYALEEISRWTDPSLLS